MMSAKMAPLGFLKINVFWNKDYVITSVNDATSNILSSDSNYIVDVFCNFYERSYHDFNFIMVWPEKTLFWGVVLVQVQ